MERLEGEGLFWAWSTLKHSDDPSTSPTLWRVGPPDYHKRVVAEHVYEGRAERFSVAVAGGRWYVMGAQLWAAQRAQGPYRAVSASPPGMPVGGEPWLQPSSHYGVVMSLWTKLYEVRLPPAGPVTR